jgi:hypothetical protein
MSENTLATNEYNDATDAAIPQDGNQAQATKTYSQEEVDNMMARMKGSIQKKLLKPYEDLGDPEELRQLKAEADKRQQEQQLKRGEFEKTLQDLAAKKDAEISKRDSIIKEYKINTPLISAAAKYNAVNADQVKALLSSNIRLGDSGEVEVVDSKGSVRYSDKGEPIGVDDLVKEFLDTNPHFKLANPATTATKSNVSGATSGKKIDLSNIDMRNPEHKAAYKEYRKTQGLA